MIYIATQIIKIHPHIFQKVVDRSSVSPFRTRVPWRDQMEHFLLLLFLLSPAPCVPQNIQNNLDCLSGVLNVTWQSTGHAPHFHTSVVSSNGHINICKTDKHHCVVHNMQCGLTYNVTVVAQDEACNSSHSPTKQVNTGIQDISAFLKYFRIFTLFMSLY